MTERKPLLSDERIEAHLDTAGTGFFRHQLLTRHNLGGPAASFNEGASFARSFYENALDRGELMVVKTTRNMDSSPAGWRCSECKYSCIRATQRGSHGQIIGNMKRCPGCGAKIVEP